MCLCVNVTKTAYPIVFAGSAGTLHMAKICTQVGVKSRLRA